MLKSSALAGLLIVTFMFPGTSHARRPIRLNRLIPQEFGVVPFKNRNAKLGGIRIRMPSFDFQIANEDGLAESPEVEQVTHFLEVAASNLINQEQSLGGEFEDARYVVGTALRDASAEATFSLYDSAPKDTPDSWHIFYAIDFDTDHFLFVRYDLGT